MLVLSRRLGDKIVFPGLDITVGILQTNGRTVRVGIEAPRDVAVLRHELSTQQTPRTGELLSSRKREDNHRIRNRLNTARLALFLMQKQLEAGKAGDAQVTLTRAVEAIEAAESTLRPTGIATDNEPSLRLRALLVEDDPNESELLAGILRMSGIAVDTAGDGCQALDYLASHERPDVVLLDMRLPRCDGPSTVSAIRNDPHLHGLKVFAVSGSTAAEEGLTLGPNGVDRWFSKPLDPNRLVREMTHDLAAMHTSA